MLLNTMYTFFSCGEASENTGKKKSAMKLIIKKSLYGWTKKRKKKKENRRDEVKKCASEKIGQKQT